MQRNGLAPGCDARVAMRDIMSTKLTTLAAAGALCSAHWRLRLLARRPHWVKPQVLRPTHRFLRVYFVNTTKLGQPNRKRQGPRRRHSGLAWSTPWTLFSGRVQFLRQAGSLKSVSNSPPALISLSVKRAMAPEGANFCWLHAGRH
jgi:hypothetical protein